MFTNTVDRITTLKLKISNFFSSEQFHELFFLFNSTSYILRTILAILLLILFIRQIIKTKRSPLLRAHAQRNTMVQNDVGNIITVVEWHKSNLDYLTKVHYRGSQWSAKIDNHDKNHVYCVPQPGLYKIVGMEGNSLLLTYNGE